MSFQRSLVIGALAGLLTVTGQGMAGAQGLTTGAISGRVTASSGEALGGAQVEIQNTATGFRVAVAAQDNGRYFVPGLAVGEYMRDQLPRSTLVVVDNVGHCPHLSAPSQSSAVMDEFLAKEGL